MEETKGWAKVFEQIEKDKDRIMIQQISVDGKKKTFKADELVFFLGNLRCVLDYKSGWRFEERNN